MYLCYSLFWIFTIAAVNEANTPTYHKTFFSGETKGEERRYVVGRRRPIMMTLNVLCILIILKIVIVNKSWHV